MRLEDQLRDLSPRSAEFPRLVALIDGHVLVAELHPGLDDHADRALEGALELEIVKGLAMDVDGLHRRVPLRDLEVVERFRGAARNRHLGADDVDWRIEVGPPSSTPGTRG